MLNPFGKKAKLIREVERLCIFNDKGWGINRNIPGELERARDQSISEIELLLDQIDSAQLPEGFRRTVNSRDFKEDYTGRYSKSSQNSFQG